MTRRHTSLINAITAAVELWINQGEPDDSILAISAGEDGTTAAELVELPATLDAATDMVDPATLCYDGEADADSIANLASTYPQ